MPEEFEKKLRRFFRVEAGLADRRAGCPSDTAIAAFVDGNADARERQQIEVHLGRCPACLEQVAFLSQSSEAALPQMVPAEWLARARALPDSKLEGRASWTWSWAAVAGAVGCILLVVVVMLRHSGPPTPAMSPAERIAAPGVRGPAAPSVGPELLSPAPGAALSERNPEFQWTPVADAADYQITILTASGDIVWEQETQATSVKLAGDVHLKFGQKYFVVVRAALREGKWLRSKPTPFVVRETP